MSLNKRKNKAVAIGFVGFAVAVFFLCSCGGKKVEIDQGEELEPAVLGGGGSVVSGGQVQTVAGTTSTTTIECHDELKSLATPTFVDVNQVITATSGIDDWTVANLKLPFTGTPVLLGAEVTDGQTPFQYSFTWAKSDPDYETEYDYELTEAHIVIDTKRDTSDTEGIFVDGVLSGRPPPTLVQTTSPELDYSVYVGNGTYTENSYFNSYSIAHYKRQTRNSFDLLLSDLLEPSAEVGLTAEDVLADGKLNVATGDDSPVYQAYLVIRGTYNNISPDRVSCSDSSDFTFTNDYLHNDGNTIGSEAFTGTVGSPFTSWNDRANTDAFEMYFDAPLPKVTTTNISLTNAMLSATMMKDVSGDGEAAIVINGVGVSTSGFNRSNATAVVESWNDGATTAFETFMSTVTTTAGAKQLDLIGLLGATTVRGLIAQGNLNIAIAGDLYLSANATTSSREFETTVNGPELLLDGTYYTEICVFQEPTPEYEEVCDSVVNQGTEDIVTNDGSGPIISSLTATEIKSTSVQIRWTTNEGATTQVGYGVGTITTWTILDSTLVTSHKVNLTGLLPYKYYKYQVKSVDQYGNESISAINIFTTLR